MAAITIERKKEKSNKNNSQQQRNNNKKKMKIKIPIRFANENNVKSMTRLCASKHTFSIS